MTENLCFVQDKSLTKARPRLTLSNVEGGRVVIERQATERIEIATCRIGPFGVSKLFADLIFSFT